MDRIIKYLLSFFFLIIIGVLCSTLLIGYKNFLNVTISWLNLPEYADQIYRLVSQQKFRVFQIILAVLAVFWLGLLIYSNVLHRIITFFLSDLYTGAVKIITNILNKRLALFLLVPVPLSVYCGFAMPVSYDEAWTYINFTDRNAITSLSYYPAPNNHILYSFLTNITNIVPDIHPLIKMRGVSLIVNITSILCCFHFMRKFSNEKTALVVSAIFPVLWMSIYYSYMARGYGLIMLFFILSCNMAFNIIYRDGRWRDWAWFSIFSVLGLFTIPSYLYPFLTLNTIIFLSNYRQFRRQFIANVIISILVVGLYFPVIVVNGVDALVSNPYVTPLQRKEVWQHLPEFFKNTLHDLTGLPWTVTAVLLLVSATGSFVQKRKDLLVLSFIFLSSPFLLLWLHSVIPFSRTFSYYTFVLPFLILLPWSEYLARIKQSILLPSLVAIQLMFGYVFLSSIGEYEKYSIDSKRVVNSIAGNYSYSITSGLFDAYLLFHLKTQGFTNYQVNYSNQNQTNADTATHTNYMIIDHPYDVTSTREPLFKTPYYNVYRIDAE